MGRLAAAESLLSTRSNVRFELATPADDADIRRLLRENPMPGEIALSMEREPDASLAAGVEGDVHRTILARDETRDDQLIAMGSLAVRDAYLNGEIRRVGYLGQLRLDRRFRPRASVIARGYEFFRREMLPTIDVDLLFTSIAADNAPARRLLERELPGMPVYRPIDSFNTYVIRAASRGRRTRINIEPADATRLNELLDCLHRNASRSQLAPFWHKEELRQHIASGELRPVIAARCGRVIGCMAVWDQSSFKQTVIRGYSPRFCRWRSIINLVAPMLDTPHLPSIGTKLDLAYLSHIAVDGDDPEIFAALLSSLTTAQPSNRSSSLFVLGLAQRHPLAQAIPPRLRRRIYRTNLYTVSWPGDRHEIALDADRPCQPEVALL